MKFFGSPKKLINKIKNGENVPNLEVVEAVLVQYNLGKHVKRYGFLLFARKYKKQLLDTGLDALETATKQKQSIKQLKQQINLQEIKWLTKP